jgi:hypothetical protein
MNTYVTDDADADLPEHCDYREVDPETAREFLERPRATLSRLRSEDTTYHIWTAVAPRLGRLPTDVLPLILAPGDEALVVRRSVRPGEPWEYGILRRLTE